MVLHLEPETSHVRVDEARIAEVLVTPHPLEQLIPRQHRAGVVGEFAEQAELGLGEVEFLAALVGEAQFAAQFDVTERADERRGCRAVQVHTPQERTDPRREFLRHDRLRDVVVGAGFETCHHVVRVGLGRDDDDRHDALGPDLATHVEARHVGQTEVEQHQIGRVLLEGRQSVGAVGGLADRISLVLEGEGQGEADSVVVLDEQQRFHGCRPL